MKRQIMLLAAMGVLFSATVAQGIVHPWVKYEAKKYGFSMLVPKGTNFVGKEWKDGWGGLFANYWGVKLWGLAHLGQEHTPAQIEAFGLLVTGIPAKKWKLLEQGKNKNGWKWYRTWKAQRGKALVFGTYGVGSKGSYLLILKTSTRSYAKHKDAYMRWYKNQQVE